MIIFILIFFATIIAVASAAVLGFSFFWKRRAKSLQTTDQKQFTERPPYRSLFEPDDEEIRALEREEKSKSEAEKLDAARRVSFEKAERAKEFKAIWLESPTRKNTIELLSSAAQSESAEIFSETSENVVKIWRENKIKNLNARDLADLLDSHLAILPQQERASGAIFWLKREIADLRREPES